MVYGGIMIGHRMKKIFSLSIILCMALVMLAGCNPELVSSSNPLGDKSKAAKEIGEEVIGYLKSGDAEALKAMFCDELKNSDDFDEKIDELMGFIDEEIVLYENDGGSGGREPAWETIRPELTKIETDSGKYYHIYMSVYIKNDDPGKLGMNMFQINTLGDEDENGDRMIMDGNRVTLYVK